MHTLAHCRSEDVSTSSKTSMNVLQSSPLGTTGKREGDMGDPLIQKYIKTTAPSPSRKVYNSPQDINHEFDTSDTDDCESVGSNSPTLEDVNQSFRNFRGGRLDKSNPKSLMEAKVTSSQGNPCHSHVGTKLIGYLTPNKGKDENNVGLKSTLPISIKNSSSNNIIPDNNLRKSNNTKNIELNKHLQVGGVGNNSPRHEVQVQASQNMEQSTSRSKASCMGSTNYPLAKNVLRDSSSVQSNHQIIRKPDDYICLDEGDGGGPPINTKTQNASNHNNNNVLGSQHQYKEDQEYFDEGDGGGYRSTNYEQEYFSSRKGRLYRHGRRSRERSGGSKKVSRGGSRGSSSTSRTGSQGSYQIHSSRTGKGSNRTSRGGSQGSSRHSCRGHTQHRRKKKGIGHRSKSQSSGSGSESWIHEDGLSALIGHKPYPANWRCFGRRPPAMHEFRPLGEVRLKNVRPAGKIGYLMRNADNNCGCQGPYASDVWDNAHGLAKPLASQLSTPLPYGTRVIRVGDIDPYFQPSRGDIIIINPAQNFYKAMESGFVLTYRGRGYSFGVGDLIVRLGRFMPNGEYIPYGNLELYMYTQTRDMRLLGRQPFLLVDFNYHNLDYESPGKHLAIGTFLTETFFPRRGDIIIRGGTWAENYPNIQRKHHSSVKYWRPRMEFLPNDILLRPYVDIGRKYDQSGKKFYWGAAELYTYSGKGLAWAYWGRDDHICDKRYPHENEHGIKTGHHKDEVGHYGDGPQETYGGRYDHGHRANDGCHIEHELFRHHNQHRSHSHQANDDCHSEHDLSHRNHHTAHH